MPDVELTETKILNETPRLGLDDRFTFRCHPGLDCFGKCCNDVSILLTPYDVLRLERALKMDSSEFLEKHTFPMSSREKQAPVVFLRMNHGTKNCPFLTEKGCSVYAHRPWACRMYPVGMAEPENETSEARRFFFIVQENLCHGHGVGDGQTVREWTQNQGVEPYDMAQASFRRLMFNPGWSNPETITPQQMSMYFMALYDLDRFRRFVFESSFLEFFDVDEARAAALRTDDEELLEFAIDWLSFSLFHEKRMRLKKNVPERVAVKNVKTGVSPG